MLLEKQKNPTIRDVAREAGVSTMTVTRAFRENALITEKTRKRVVEAARKLKFIPDQNAKILRGGSSMSIGILMSNPSGSELVRNLSVMLMKEGYVSFVADSLGDIQIVKSALMDFCSRKVGGVILSWRSYYRDIPEIMDLLNQLRNVVLYSYESEVRQELIFDTCILDFSDAYRKAITELINAGRRRIIYLGRDDQSQFHDFIEAVQDCGLKTEDCLWKTSGYPSKPAFANYRDALHDKILAGERPDAIFAANDIAAAQACLCLREHNLRIPEDVAVIGSGNNYLGAFCSPALATIDTMSLAVSENIYAMLMPRIKQPDIKPQFKKVECLYIPRESAAVEKQKGHR